MPLQVTGDPEYGNSADACTDLLDTDHERVAEQQRPEQTVAILRTGLRIGADSTWVIVRGSGDQAWAQQPTAPLRLCHDRSAVVGRGRYLPTRAACGIRLRQARVLSKLPPVPPARSQPFPRRSS